MLVISKGQSFDIYKVVSYVTWISSVDLLYNTLPVKIKYCVILYLLVIDLMLNVYNTKKKKKKRGRPEGTLKEGAAYVYCCDSIIGDCM